MADAVLCADGPNAKAPQLWRRFTLGLRLHIAKTAGLPWPGYARSWSCRSPVAEYQGRGVVHFHAILRADGPSSPPPDWATYEMLANAVDQAARAVTLITRSVAGLDRRTLRRGGQLAVRPVTTSGELTDQAVAPPRGDMARNYGCWFGTNCCAAVLAPIVS